MSLHHLNSPVIAGIDVLSAGAVIGWWFDVVAHPIGVIATALAGIWYGFCIYQFIEDRWFK